MRVGGRVVEDGNTDVGTIVECNNPHNVEIEFELQLLNLIAMNLKEVNRLYITYEISRIDQKHSV